MQVNKTQNDINIREIFNRVSNLFKLNTDTLLGEFFDVPQTTITTWKSRNSSKALMHIIPKCISKNINLNWLITGSGEAMITPQEPSNSNSMDDFARYLQEEHKQLKVEHMALKHRIEELEKLKGNQIAS